MCEYPYLQLGLLAEMPDYVDSGDDTIVTFDFDEDSNLTNKKLFANPPEAMDDQPTNGVFDGLAMDGLGNVWIARFKDRRVIGYNPDGKIICYISTSKMKNPTIPCFGGKNLDQMYIVGAHSKLANEGDIQDRYPQSGDMLKVDFGPGSEIRKLLGENWKGAERFRYKG
jgi:sugar lactone lactonase YvrE